MSRPLPTQSTGMFSFLFLFSPSPPTCIVALPSSLAPRLTISCYYENDDFKMLQFLPEDRSFDRPPQPAFGEMRVRMRLATGEYLSSH